MMGYAGLEEDSSSGRAVLAAACGVVFEIGDTSGPGDGFLSSVAAVIAGFCGGNGGSLASEEEERIRDPEAR
ncbi:hypothetical protein ACLOJK_028086 [Asimina triloba]